MYWRNSLGICWSCTETTVAISFAFLCSRIFRYHIFVGRELKFAVKWYSNWRLRCIGFCCSVSKQLLLHSSERVVIAILKCFYSHFWRVYFGKLPCYFGDEECNLFSEKSSLLFSNSESREKMFLLHVLLGKVFELSQKISCFRWCPK